MKYLIKDTTPEERLELVKKALSISLSGAENPSAETIELAKKYIDGSMELEEIQQLIVQKYKKEEKSE